MKRLSQAKNVTCGNCYYWYVADQSNALFGQCHRHAPIAAPVYLPAEEDSAEEEMEEPPPVTVWPETRSDDFCGDFEGR